MNIGVVGVNHNLAPINVREAVSFTDTKKIEAINILLDREIDEIVILSTCNRSEIYISGENIKQKVDEVANFYKDYFSNLWKCFILRQPRFLFISVDPNIKIDAYWAPAQSFHAARYAKLGQKPSRRRSTWERRSLSVQSGCQSRPYKVMPYSRSSSSLSSISSAAASGVVPLQTRMAFS